MATRETIKRVAIIPGVKVSLEGETVRVSGPLGELQRRFHHPRIRIEREADALAILCSLPRKKDWALMGTWGSHLRNMMKGVTQGYVYEMKVVYSHFPIKAHVEGSTFVIENFLGERYRRTSKILPGVKVTVAGDRVRIEGTDVERVGQTAANIEIATRVGNYDPRVFQDGIYIVSKR